MSYIDVIIEELSNHPHCSHGPTILFSRSSEGNNVQFFACSACRTRKECPFYLCKDDLDKATKSKLQKRKIDKVNFVEGVNHRKLFVILNKVQQLCPGQRYYCNSCNTLIVEQSKHDDHDILTNISDYMLSHPSELLKPLDNAKKEAQFLFSKCTVKTVVDMMQHMGFKNILNIGTPRIHEYIMEQCPSMQSLLLDIDKRYNSFFGPLQFCWYNMFNNYFFLPQSEQIFHDFLQIESGAGIVLAIDPPFGGRVELLAETVKAINKLYRELNKLNTDLSVIWFFPYFMEPQVINSLPEYKMLDYKVDYDNHPLFNNKSKGRKYGSPVRIFTNIDPSIIVLPVEQGYKYCKSCNQWVSTENRHCEKCNACTSKNGQTYIHCDICNRCVKPTWIHCDTCMRCIQRDHICGTVAFTRACFHCNEVGHKKRQCPKVDHEELFEKRKRGIKIKLKKLKKRKLEK